MRDAGFEIREAVGGQRMADGGIYIHVPFCLKRCPYCAFTLIESDGSLHERYVAAIEKQLAGVPVARTLYFGGGTPSMLKPEQVARLIRGRYEEITLEANPEHSTWKPFREIGVNRLTLGVQSTDAAALKFLGRNHTPARARAAFDEARAAGFANICVDLIFGFPGQTVAGWRSELQSWKDADHVSIYGLTVEKGTALERDVIAGLKLPGEGLERDLYEAAMDILPSMGFEQYELSNFAKPGFESIHNSGYWDGRPYLGFGPGAHSFETPRRWSNVANVSLYLERVERGETVLGMEETLTPDQRRLERIFLGLRRRAGLDVAAFDREFGMKFDREYAKTLAEVAEMVERKGDRLALTRRGRLLADAVVGKFA